MDEPSQLAERFEAQRPQLRAVAYRMLGSLAEAEEAVQDAWLRASRAGTDGIDNVGGWLTTIVARVCLSALQARKARLPDSAVPLPDPIVTRDGAPDPEAVALLADSVGLALQIVLETLPPSERLAFVLHDLFDVPFAEIAPMVGRSATAARQLASRARRRVRGAAVPTADADPARQRPVVDAFFAAARDGDFDALAALLDPDVVLRADGGARRPGASFVRRGVAEVTRSAFAGALPAAILRPVLVNGAAGVVVMLKDRPFALMAFTLAADKIVAIDALLDPDRLSRLDLTALL